MSREAAEEREPEMTQSRCKVFVEKVAQELADAIVGPSAVHEQKPL